MTNAPLPPLPPPLPTKKYIGSGEDTIVGDELKDLIPVTEEEDALALH